MTEQYVGVADVKDSLLESFGDYSELDSGKVRTLPSVSRMPAAEAKKIWDKVWRKHSYQSWSVANKTMVLDALCLFAVKATTSPLANWDVELLISPGSEGDSTSGSVPVKAKIFRVQDIRDQIIGHNDELRRFMGNYVQITINLLRDTTNDAVRELRSIIAKRYGTNSPAIIPYCFDFALCMPEAIPDAYYAFLSEHKVNALSLRAAPVENAKPASANAEEKARQMTKVEKPSPPQIRGLSGL